LEGDIWEVKLVEDNYRECGVIAAPTSSDAEEEYDSTSLEADSGGDSTDEEDERGSHSLATDSHVGDDSTDEKDERGSLPLVGIFTESDSENVEDQRGSPPLVDISTDSGGDSDEDGQDGGSPPGCEEIGAGGVSQIYVNYPPALKECDRLLLGSVREENLDSGSSRNVTILFGRALKSWRSLTPG